MGERQKSEDESREEVEAWQSLVHVCHRWRAIVFEYSSRLNLRLYCESRTPVRLLDVWPALPLFIQEHWYYPTDDPEYVDNVLPALKQGHRACTIDLEIYDPRLEIVWAAMQESFPQLIDLIIDKSDEMKGIPDQIPDSFLGGSAPRLRRLQLGGIPYPGLPKLLLSTTQLAVLCLSEITHSDTFPLRQWSLVSPC